MKLYIVYDRVTQGCRATYVIFPDIPGNDVVQCTDADFPHIAALATRIAQMARRMLGENFISVTPERDIGLFFRVKVGTSTAKKKELGAFFEWVKACDSKPARTTKA